MNGESTSVSVPYLGAASKHKCDVTEAHPTPKKATHSLMLSMHAHAHTKTNSVGF